MVSALLGDNTLIIPKKTANKTSKRSSSKKNNSKRVSKKGIKNKKKLVKGVRKKKGKRPLSQ